MAAQVLRKPERVAQNHRRIAATRRREHRQQATGQQAPGRQAPGRQRECLSHQSARTARTASWLSAARQLQMAVTAAAGTRAALSNANCHTGTARSMLQLKDCRLMT